MKRAATPIARATSAATLEWKKRVDAWIGVPLAWLCGVVRSLFGRRAAPPDDPRHVVVAKVGGANGQRLAQGGVQMLLL